MSEYSTWDRPLAPLDPVLARAAETWFDLPCGSGERLSTEAPVGLLVGEQPGPRSNHRLPLWPYPARSAGGRLHAMSGVPMVEYLARLARVNLAAQPRKGWDHRRARFDLHAMLNDLPPDARVVLCGQRAMDAYEEGYPGARRQFLVLGGSVWIQGVPHPSGRCREYNDPATVAATREAVRWAADWEQQP